MQPMECDFDHRHKRPRNSYSEGTRIGLTRPSVHAKRVMDSIQPTQLIQDANDAVSIAEEIFNIIKQREKTSNCFNADNRDFAFWNTYVITKDCTFHFKYSDILLPKKDNLETFKSLNSLEQDILTTLRTSTSKYYKTITTWRKKYLASKTLAKTSMIQTQAVQATRHMKRKHNDDDIDDIHNEDHDSVIVVGNVSPTRHIIHPRMAPPPPIPISTIPKQATVTIDKQELAKMQHNIDILQQERKCYIDALNYMHSDIISFIPPGELREQCNMKCINTFNCLSVQINKIYQ